MEFFVRRMLLTKTDDFIGLAQHLNIPDNFIALSQVPFRHH